MIWPALPLAQPCEKGWQAHLRMVHLRGRVGPARRVEVHGLHKPSVIDHNVFEKNRTSFRELELKTSIICGWEFQKTPNTPYDAFGVFGNTLPGNSVAHSQDPPQVSYTMLPENAAENSKHTRAWCSAPYFEDT